LPLPTARGSDHADALGMFGTGARAFAGVFVALC